MKTLYITAISSALITSILLQSLSYCQEVVIYQAINYSDVENNIIKNYEDPSWACEKELSINGWIKISPQHRSKELSSVFSLSVGLDPQLNKSKQFVNVFTLLHSNYCIMITTSNLNSEVSFPDSDCNFILTQDNYRQWIFFYLGHNENIYYSLAYFNFSTRTSTSVLPKVSIPSGTKYKFVIGNLGGYNYFYGELVRLIFHVGKDAYREEYFGDYIYLKPDSLPRMPVFYDKCAFSGSGMLVGDEDLNKEEFHSVYVPHKKIVVACIKGRKYNLMKNIECLTEEKLQELIEFNYLKEIQDENDDCQT